MQIGQQIKKINYTGEILIYEIIKITKLMVYFDIKRENGEISYSGRMYKNDFLLYEKDTIQVD